VLVRAYVLRAPGAPLREESLALHELHGDLVRVRMLASGVCRSDLRTAAGLRTILEPEIA